MSLNTFETLMYIWMAIAVLLLPVQLLQTAPYGRHTTSTWGALMDNRWGWILMEIVSLLTMAWFFLDGSNEKTVPTWIFFGLWVLHYLNRSIIYPLRMHTTGKRIPVVIVLSAVAFNVVNGWTNGYYLGSLDAGIYSPDWLQDIRFIAGLTLFAAGAWINFQSDNILLSLRKPGETGYKIPYGGWFRLVSCPNHFGEILEWFGFALMCWNLPALGFAIWTATNLIPRSISHHRWYCRHFPDYPSRRKAVFPFLL